MPANLLAFPREITSLWYSAIARSSFSVLSNSFLGIFIEVNTASGTINFIMYTTVVIAVTCSHLLSKSDSNIYKSSSSLYVITPIITSVFQVLPSVHSSGIHPAPHLKAHPQCFIASIAAVPASSLERRQQKNRVKTALRAGAGDIRFAQQKILKMKGTRPPHLHFFGFSLSRFKCNRCLHQIAAVTVFHALWYEHEPSSRNRVQPACRSETTPVICTILPVVHIHISECS